jgi:hypothetical protein
MDNLFALADPTPPVASGVSPQIASQPKSASYTFDWRSDDSIVLGYQPATAIYRNASDAIVIRQEGVGYEDDQFVILRDAEAVQVVIKALTAEIEGARS